MKAHNIMEDIVEKHFLEMVSKGTDMCMCDLCQAEIISYVLSRIPAKYVTTDAGAMHTIMEQVQVEQSSVVLKELIYAMKYLKENPVH